MYKISKRIEISGGHWLLLPYASKCMRVHGHNWIITVHCRSEELDMVGMVVDFTDIKKLLHDKLDHRLLNDVLTFNPTAENLAKWVVDTVPKCYRAEVQESEGNVASYELPGS